MDLEKGPGGSGEYDEPSLLAADGSEVLIVDWKGEDDPAFPKNWSNRRRMGATLIVAAFTFLSPLSSTMVAPAVGQIATKFNITSIFNLACAFSTNTGMMLAFRFLAGIGGSAPLAIGAGVLGDLWCVLVQVAGLILLRETFAPELLLRQARVLKKEMSLPPDSDRVQTVFEVKTGRQSVKHILSHGLSRPFDMIMKESILVIFSLYMMVIYGVIYITIVVTTDIFVNIYHESIGVAGTNFVAQGLGFFIQGRAMDVIYRKLKERNGGVGKPEFRLPLMVPASIFLPIGLLLFGWGPQHHLHWIVADIGLFLIAAGMIGNFQCMTTYLIDVYGIFAASALAAATFARSLCGFAFPLFAPALFTALGYGWGCTLLALVSAAVGLPAVPVLYKYGERIRQSGTYTAK
ncbi:hypothetical protein RQP46_004995 [Phenoliferia psychrophenolica]